MPAWTLCLQLFLCALLTAIAATPVAAWLARRTGLLDHPNARKIHAWPMPMLGGLPVVAALGLTLPTLTRLDAAGHALLGGCLLLHGLGLADDRWDLPSRYRLIAQCVIAGFLTPFGFCWSVTGIGFLDAALTVVWIVAVINAMNCLDCADGIAAGVATLSFLCLATLHLRSGQSQLALTALAAAGASLGFLTFNFPPARIFLGDAGSTVLGLLLGVLSVGAAGPPAGAAASPDRAGAAAVAWLILLVPVYDLLLVHLRRYAAGTRGLRDLLSSTGKDHLPHRLLGRGLTSAQTAFFLYGLTALSAVAVLALTAGSLLMGFVVLTLAAGALLAVETGWTRWDGARRHRFPGSRPGSPADTRVNVEEGGRAMPDVARGGSTDPPATREAGLEGLALLIVALMAAVPLVAAPDPIAWRGYKDHAYEVMGLLLTGIVLLTATFQGVWSKTGRFLRGGPNLPILLLLAYGALSCRLSNYPGLSRHEWNRLAWGAMLFFVVAYRFQDRRYFRKVIDLVVGAAIALAVASLLYRPAGQVVDLGGPFWDRQLYGAVLMLLMPILLMISIGMTDIRRRFAAQIATVLVVACLLLTRCRSAWLGAIVALLVVGVLAAVFVAPESRWRRRKHELVWLPVVVVCAVALFVGISGGGELIGRRTQTFQRLMTDNSVVDRLRLWDGAVRMVKARPWLGWGIGSYPMNQTHFTRGAYRAEVVRLRGPSMSDLAHNEYLQTAAETGVIGLGLHLAVVLAFLLFGLQTLARMENGLRKYVLIGCMAALVGKLVDSFANPGWRFADVGFYQWLALGLGSAAARIGSIAERADSARSHLASRVDAGVRKVGRRTWQGAVCLLVALSVGSVTAAPAPEEIAGLNPEYTDITGCRVTPESTVYIAVGECVDFQYDVSFAGAGSFTVSTGDGVSWDDPELVDGKRCVVRDPENTYPGRYCVPLNADWSCFGKELHASASYGGCRAASCFYIVPMNLRRFLEFQIIGAPTNRIYPPDNTLRKIYIRPVDLDHRFEGMVVKLVKVSSDSGGQGTQPELEIVDDTSDATSPEIAVCLRAALNPGGKRRIYTLEFEGGTQGPDCITGKAVLNIDVSAFSPRLGGFSNRRN